jgi:hypothetical protein
MGLGFASHKKFVSSVQGITLYTIGTYVLHNMYAVECELSKWGLFPFLVDGKLLFVCGEGTNCTDKECKAHPDVLHLKCKTSMNQEEAEIFLWHELLTKTHHIHMWLAAKRARDIAEHEAHKAAKEAELDAEESACVAAEQQFLRSSWLRAEKKCAAGSQREEKKCASGSQREEKKCAAGSQREEKHLLAFVKSHLRLYRKAEGKVRSRTLRAERMERAELY